MLKRNRYDRILDEFEAEFPRDVENVLDWVGLGANEIVMLMKDGSRLIYNIMSKGIRCVPKKVVENESVSIDEALWRRAFGRTLKRLLMECGMTYEYLSQKTGISESTIKRYANGSVNPTGPNICRIAQVIGCTISELMYYTD